MRKCCREPGHRSTSISEFWADRWNVQASALFHRFFFAPLARRSVALGVCVAFGFSAFGHACLADLGLGRWRISLACGAFFMVQPLLIAAERRMKVRRWSPAAGRAWTLTALALASPLFVEPYSIQLMEGSWGAPGNVLGQPPPCSALCSSLAAPSHWLRSNPPRSLWLSLQSAELVGRLKDGVAADVRRL